MRASAEYTPRAHRPTATRRPWCPGNQRIDPHQSLRVDLQCEAHEANTAGSLQRQHLLLSKLNPGERLHSDFVRAVTGASRESHVARVIRLLSAARAGRRAWRYRGTWQSVRRLKIPSSAS